METERKRYIYNHLGKNLLVEEGKLKTQIRTFSVEHQADFLKSENFIHLKSDRCVFKKLGKSPVYITIHVDNGLVLGNNTKVIDSLMNKLHGNFEANLNWNPKNYLGMELIINKLYN